MIQYYKTINGLDKLNWINEPRKIMIKIMYLIPIIVSDVKVLVYIRNRLKTVNFEKNSF